ncbi:DNA polymerase III subunit gamma/tau [Shewanella youngdeokensis]|uniref:DNA-directed DNA polymerase n=1 Tax=Shewanella youngdeokensis TaxID=2999068 RepID=A0ABZ0K3J3_9GAMM|nr:DNA polymerase III subunit gamma/tau [Shewanella sp. DAU334]
MSYQVLARKWRPAKFEQMVGQSHVLHALTNALTQQRLHHAYLFSGTRGVGKTSIARLFAKGLNCEQGVTATPCGKCSACVEISEGRFVDLIEVDAASRTKVDDTRELLDNVQYRPSRGRYKVYLIDEVHMLSRSSFNALLKTLEEPPEHVKFLLATTDPQRLPVTVLSRCLQFNLKSLTQEEIGNQLSNILTRETLSFEPAALTLLAKAANGSMRDALSLTDQAIAFGAGQVKLEQVQTMLGSIDEKQVLALLEALANADVMALMQVSANVLSFGAEPEEVLRSLLELLHQITLTQFAPAAAQMSLYSEQINAFAQQLAPEQVQLYYQLLLTGRKDLPHAPDPKSGLEMALLRAVTFVPDKPVSKWVTDNPATIAIPKSDVKPLPGSANSEKKTVVEADAKRVPSHAKLPQVPLADTQGAAVSEEASSAGDDLESMNSEMAVIISQAQSQGYSKPDTSDAQPVLVESESTDIATPESESAQVTAPAMAEHLSPVPTTESEPEVAEFDATSVHNTDVNENVEPALSIAPESYVGEDDLSAYSQYAGAQASDFDDNGFESGGFDVDAFNSTNIQPEAANVAAPELIDSLPAVTTSLEQSVAQTTPAADSANLDDDILDAVLAARDSLLSGLGEDDLKESSAKKSDKERKPFTPPKRKPQPLAAEAVVANNSEAEPSNTAAGQASDIIDRPPWEAPHEQDPCARFEDVNASQTVVESAPVAADTGTASPTYTQTAESASIKEVVDVGSLTSVQEHGLHLPTLPSGELTGNDIDLKWYRFMAELEVGGRVRQLAVNSVCHNFEQPLSLLLKPDQKHLAAGIAIEQLEEAMSLALGEPCTVKITVGLDNIRETPLEVRRRFHQELLAQAHHGLMEDENIRWLTAYMGAQLTPDSLSYAPELLVNKGKTIELVDMSNFKRLPES